MPKISVIVPVYNAEEYLPRCIDSVLTQTFTDFELILVNDGSPDNCGKICDEYAERDSRIVVVHKENGGVSNSRNTGLNMAKGDYIGFIDSDDFIHPQMYEILYNSLIKNNADLSEGLLVYTNKEISTFENITSYNITELEIKDICSKMYTYDPLLYNSVVTKLFKAEIFNDLRFPENISYSEDAYMVISIMDKCKKILKIDCTLYYYFRQRMNSLSHQPSLKNSFDDLFTINKCLNFVLDKKFFDISDNLVEKYIFYFLYLYYETVEKKEFKSALKAHKKIFKSSCARILKNCKLCNLHKAIIYLALVNPILARGLFKKALK